MHWEYRVLGTIPGTEDRLVNKRLSFAESIGSEKLENKKWTNQISDTKKFYKETCEDSLCQADLWEEMGCELRTWGREGVWAWPSKV